eukprot:scaffold103804_cov40-Phaeocystis_antarctica.AAC.1
MQQTPEEAPGVITADTGALGFSMLMHVDARGWRCVEPGGCRVDRGQSISTEDAGAATDVVAEAAAAAEAISRRLRLPLLRKLLPRSKPPPRLR